MNLALAIEIIIIAGFFGGRAAHWIKFPMITGYIIVGVLLITVSRFTGKYLGTIAGQPWPSHRRWSGNILAWLHCPKPVSVSA
ncbi:MAG: hypothetical protein QGI51_02755 [Dehalococcoidales bacterium]|nr:hypothetical protein [Dehalococcoidales bacterium]